MTQLSTVANQEVTTSPSATPGVIASIAVALVVGMGLGLFVSNIDVTPETQATSNASAVRHEQFLRLNTEDLEHLAPMGLTAAPAVVGSSNPFLIRNVDSYDWLSQAISNRHAVGSHFLEINTAGLESTSTSGAILTGPRGDIIRDSEPFGYPNYGRLETYVGAQPEGGVR